MSKYPALNLFINGEKGEEKKESSPAQTQRTQPMYDVAQNKVRIMCCGAKSAVPTSLLWTEGRDVTRRQNEETEPQL